MRDAIRYLGEHSPVPVHCIPNAGLPLQGPDGETIFPEEPEPLAERAGRVRRALRRGHRRRVLRHHARPHPGDRRARRWRPAGPAPRGRRRPGLLDDDLHSARAGPAADAGRRAGQLAGLAQGQGAAAGRRLRRPRHGGRGPGDRRRPRARRLRRADRAPGRGRPDGRGGQAHLADPARADADRLDRARGDRACAGADPRPRDRQLGQPRGRPRQGSTAWCRSPRLTARR